MKQLVIFGLSVGAIYLLYNAWKKQQDAEKTEKITEKPLEEKPVEAEAPIVCPEGLIICESNKKKCFDPKVRYIVDPCKA
jgi:threonine/homoserine/homoserine lactone efflux protein